MQEREFGKRKVIYDFHRDILEIDGMKFSGQIFAHLSDCANQGRLFRFEKIEDGCIVVKDMEEIKDRFEKLDHFKSTVVGLWATDKTDLSEEDKQKLNMFEIKE